MFMPIRSRIQNSPNYRWSGFLVAFSVLSGTLLPAQEEGTDSKAYRVTLQSNMTMSQTGEAGSQQIDATTNFAYRWQYAGLKQTLLFDEMSVKVSSGQQLLMNNSMTRKQFVDRTSNPATVMAYENAPPQLQAILKDSFGTPVAEITVDAEGTQESTRIVAAEGAGALLNQGMVENAQLMHPPIPKGKTSWKSVRKISMGNGGFAEGELTYTLVDGGKSGQKVSVTGTMKNDKFAQPGAPVEIRNAQYQVTGSQEFDPASRIWLDGKLDIKVSFKIFVQDMPVSSADGTIQVSLGAPVVEEN